MNIEEIYTRKKLRQAILKQLYDLYFSGGPEWPSKTKVMGLTGTKKQLYIDNEHHKAYHSLFARQMGLIT